MKGRITYLLTVNRRLGRALRKDPLSVGKKIIVWDDFVTFLFESHRIDFPVPLWRLSDLQAQRLWANAMSDFQTLGFSREKTIQCAQDAYALIKNYQLKPETLKGYKEDADLFLKAMQHFEEKCQEMQACTQANLIEMLLDHGLKKEILPSQIYCYGFDEWMPVQQVLMSYLESLGVEIKYINQFDLKGNAKKVIALNPEEELYRAACYAKKMMESNKTVAVVVPKLQEKWSNIEKQFSETFKPGYYFPGQEEMDIPYNISSGESLYVQPVIYALMETLKVLDKEISIQTWNNILHSPFLKGGCTEIGLRSLFYIELAKTESLFLSIEYVNDCSNIPVLFSEQLKQVKRYKQSIFQQRSMRDWMLWLKEWISILGWSADRTLSSAEYQCVASFYDILPSLYSLDILKPSYTFQEYKDALYDVLKNTLFQIETQDKPIQVLGLLEAAGLSFDCIWIVGLTSENYPAKSSPHPFIPTHIQIERDMPHSSPSREVRVAERLLDRLFKGATNLIVSYALHDEAGELQLESPFISSILPEQIDDIAAISQPLAMTIAASQNMHEYEDHIGLPLQDMHLKGGSRVLKDHAACPHRAYLTYRLMATSPVTPVIGLSARVQGILVHRILEKCWEQLEAHSALLAMDSESIEDFLSNIIQAVLKNWKPSIAVSNQHIEIKRLTKIICAWLEVEKSRSSFSIVSLEKRVEVVLADLKLNVTIDRIDRTKENQYLLIDYKTGEVVKEAWDDHRMDDPQLPLYAVSLQNPPSGIAYACVSKDKLFFNGVGTVSDPGMKMIDENSWEDLLRTFSVRLEKIASEIKSGYAVLDPKYKTSTCETCALQAGCRLHTGGVYER